MPIEFRGNPTFCPGAGNCGFGINLSQTESGFRSRANLTWHVTPDAMVYYTFSQGFRPGGFNRTGDTNGVPLGAAEIPYYANKTGRPVPQAGGVPVPTT
jgi:outer membrane receptor protein involved in Fe transport